MVSVALENVTKKYGRKTALRDITLTIDGGELLAVIGPPESGKSTLLRCLLGTEQVTEGRITIGGRDVTELGPRERFAFDMVSRIDWATVSEEATVFDVVASELTRRALPLAEIKRRVGEVCETELPVAPVSEEELQAGRLSEIDMRHDEVPAGLTIGGLLDQKANGLSSGYPTRFGPRERVEQVWRHLSARVADLVVADLDEVYRKREDAYRHSLLAERHVQRLKRLQTHTAAPIVCTTPRPDQALSVATRIAVLRDGVMQQIAAPEYVLQHPANDFVAGLMDSIPGTQTVQGEEGTG